MASVLHYCWQTFMIPHRIEAALRYRHEPETKRSNVDPEALFKIPYKSNLERLQIE